MLEIAGIMEQKRHTRSFELLTVGRRSCRNAMKRVAACQHCYSAASTCFQTVLDEVLDRTGSGTDYLLSESAVCPNCAHSITECTFVSLIEAEQVGTDPDSQIVVIDESQLMEAQAFVVGCECCAVAAEISFDYLLDAITGCDPLITEYVMSRPAICPQCSTEVTEKTLVVPK